MAAAIPYALLAAGTYAKMRGDKAAANDRRDILNRSLQRTQATSDDAARQVVAEGQQFTPDARAAAMQGQENAAFQRAQSDLSAGGAGGAGGDVVDTAGGAGANSAAFVKAKADKAISEGNRITDIAREMARTRGTGDLLQSEGLRRADLVQRLGSAASSSRNMAQADQLDAQNVDTPLYGKLGGLAQMAGSAWLAGGAGAGAGGAASGSGATVGAGLGDAAASGAPTALGYGAGYGMPAASSAAGGGLSAAIRNAAAMWSGGRNNRVFGGG
ncbi:hypothetical protein [Rhizobacter sp. OV335]|uniref:hypothetical protein n=1 Tax=Rhizobacter sp. OV335 TaxID=1500264 RepID=UPI00090FB7DA|nr:hypothetical protein [Rhizobacter sp. OV335]SHN40009.1 hypothetical protein SAMN02787076_06152 [Rhizobacter sp. OV335]